MKNNNKTIFHIDVNSAYLSWEAAYRLRNGETLDLRTISSVIGGDESSRHGVVLAKSTPTKKYGIQTGEPLFTARKKCPNLIIVPPQHHIYEQYSNDLIQLLEEYSPCVQPFSIDECFLDYTNMEDHFGPPIVAAHHIKERIKTELGFTVNIGISTNKLLAKMAGELKKPDLIHTLYPDEIKQKLWPLPIEELYMVGKVTAARLRSKGITTIGDIACTNQELLKSWLQAHGLLIWNYANGIEGSPVQEEQRQQAKSIGNSTTTAYDVKDKQTAYAVLLSLVETVAYRLRQANVCTELLSVSFKTAQFVTCSRQQKLSAGLDTTTPIYKVACQLFDELWKGQPLRQLGVSASSLCDKECYQLSLMEQKQDKYRKLDEMIDGIRNKYGKEAVIRSALLQKNAYNTNSNKFKS